MNSRTQLVWIVLIAAGAITALGAMLARTESDDDLSLAHDSGSTTRTSESFERRYGGRVLDPNAVVAGGLLDARCELWMTLLSTDSGITVFRDERIEWTGDRWAFEPVVGLDAEMLRARTLHAKVNAMNVNGSCVVAAFPHAESDGFARLTPFERLDVVVTGIPKAKLNVVHDDDGEPCVGVRVVVTTPTIACDGSPLRTHPGAEAKLKSLARDSDGAWLVCGGPTRRGDPRDDVWVKADGCAWQRIDDAAPGAETRTVRLVAGGDLAIEDRFESIAKFQLVYCREAETGTLVALLPRDVATRTVSLTGMRSGCYEVGVVSCGDTSHGGTIEWGAASVRVNVGAVTAVAIVH